ncbi:high-affinity nicotinic acid transporter [Penicillium hispanicum]|uniref:high-affinity nicotinic acid transporter n=1 Tax=Penicillium hispanicum TaxID=1080232 RepID=UPI00253FB893|nr:high-affinity nicotinic acid transporter [Penicillium hispanicum]KAJ5585291.1 high-affinity nicotinic acid transporter [Penicillium hispanicum]
MGVLASEIPPPEIASEDGSGNDGVHPQRILQKMDLRIMPIVSLLYFMSFLDRGNIGNAKIEGLGTDLDLTGQQYNWTLTVFFFTYAFLEIPSNMLLKKLRPSVWLPSIMCAWGLVMTLMGLVENFTGLLIARLFLGATEAGLFPGVAYYLSTWYAREYSQYRQALFFCAATVSGSFSGLLAYAISKMDGVGGLDGWRWIFILEGIATFLVAVASFFLIHDSFETCNFLTRPEKDWVASKLNNHGQGKSERFNVKYLIQAVTDWQVLVAMFMNMGILGPIYGISLFLPTIIKDLGYQSTQAQLLTIPVYVAGAIVALLSAYLSDRMGKRSSFLLCLLTVAIVGYIMMLCGAAKDEPGVVYAGVFVTVAGLYSAFPGNIAWISNNVAGDYKKSVALAIHVGCGNLGGAITSNIYRSQDSPKFILGHSVSLALVAVAFIAVTTLRLGYRLENKRRERLNEGDSQKEDAEDLGDKAPSFRYIV